MKARVLIEFNDLKENVLRKVDEEFILNKDRFEEINKVGQLKINSDLIEEVKEEPKEEAEEVKEEPKKEVKKATKRTK